MKITVRNMYDTGIETITYNNAEVIDSADYKEFFVIINGEQIAAYNRTVGMSYDIIAATERSEEIEEAKSVIKEYGAKTAYYNGEIAENDMYKMLRYRMAFGAAEAKVIIAALTLSGAKWEKQFNVNF